MPKTNQKKHYFYEQIATAQNKNYRTLRTQKNPAKTQHFYAKIVKGVNPTTQTTYALRKIRVNHYLQQQKNHR